MFRVATVACAACAACAGASSFQHGDAVPMMHRTQHASQRTAWAEVPHHVAPRFGADRVVVLDQVPEHLLRDPEAMKDQPYKISLALLGSPATASNTSQRDAKASGVRKAFDMTRAALLLVLL